ncbi:Uncharacterised protein [Fusobacterium varium]|nr:Uncharacterised protein [Fusobacterium varium]
MLLNRKLEYLNKFKNKRRLLVLQSFFIFCINIGKLYIGIIFIFLISDIIININTLSIYLNL